MFNLRLGKWFGVPVVVHYGILPFLLLMYFVFGGYACLFTAVSFFFIILHEFGHIFAARHFGIDCEKVWLTPMGGFALLDEIPRDPFKEAVIAAAGPFTIVNVYLFVWLEWGAIELSVDDLGVYR